MTRYTRQEAKARGLSTCYGSPCQTHPLLEGLRRVSGACVECARENTKNTGLQIRGARKRTEKSNVKVAEQRKTDPIKHAAKIAYDQTYRAANKKSIAQSKRAWAEKIPEPQLPLLICVNMQKNNVPHNGCPRMTTG